MEFEAITTAATTAAVSSAAHAGRAETGQEGEPFPEWAPPAERDTSADAALFARFADDTTVVPMSGPAPAGAAVAGSPTTPPSGAVATVPAPTTDPAAAAAVLEQARRTTNILRPGRRLGNNDMILGAGVASAPGVVAALDRNMREQRGLTGEVFEQEDRRRAVWAGEDAPTRQRMRAEGLTTSQRADLGRVLRSPNALTSLTGFGVVGSPPLEVEFLLSNVVALPGKGGVMSVGATGSLGVGVANQTGSALNLQFAVKSGEAKAGAEGTATAGYTRSTSTTDTTQSQTGSSASTTLAGEDQEADLKVKATDSRDGTTAYAQAGRIRVRHGE